MTAARRKSRARLAAESDIMERQVLFEERRLHNLIFRKMGCVREGEGEKRSFRLAGMIVSYLCEHAGERICQKDLEAEFFVRGSTMAAALNRLESEGFICRRADETDKRLKVVTAMPKAEEAYARLSSHVRAMEKSLVVGITPEQLSVYFEVVDKICNNLEAVNQ